MTRTCILGALVATVALLAGCLGGDDSDKAGGRERPDTVVLTLADHEPDATDLGEFAREVERQSDGSLRIEFRKEWRLGRVDYEPRTIEDVRDGRIDMAKVSARAFDLAGVRSFQPLVAPLAVDSYALERRVLGSPLAARMLDGVAGIDLVGVALLPGELRKPLGISRGLVEAPDYRGATIGTRASALGGRTFRALGARPEFYPPGGEIAAFDGTEVGLTGVAYNLLDGPAQTLALNVNLWPRVLAIVMNRDAYDALSAYQREALRAAGRSALDPAMERVQKIDKEALGVLCNRGEVTVPEATPSQLDGLRAATAPVSDDLAQNPETRDAVRQIAAMRASVEAEPAPTCSTGAGELPTRSATRVDGLWRMRSTEGEFAEIAPPGDVVLENWGEFRFAFARGRFAVTTENGKACLWAYGRYTVKGDLVELTIEDGGGRSVTEDDFFNRPGEFFTYRWSRYRDRLTLTPVMGRISPEPWRVKPWRRLEGEPSRGALASRCLPPREALQPRAGFRRNASTALTRRSCAGDSRRASLRKIWRTWVSTVFGLKKSRSRIARLEWPSAIRASTSRSREVSSERGPLSCLREQLHLLLGALECWVVAVSLGDCETERERERDKPLLRAVVKVPLETPAFGVARLHYSGA